MTILDHSIERRDFLVLSGSAAALVMLGTQTGCVTSRRRKDEEEKEEEAELIDGWGFDIPTHCQCPECIRRRMVGEWHVPDETSAFFEHEQIEFECGRKYLSAV